MNIVRTKATILFIIGFLILFSSCKKDNAVTNPPASITVPVVSTDSVSSITNNTAECGGTIASDGGATITARGVCWGTSQNPTIDSNKTADGASIGIFTSTITGLTSNTTYHVRAYATNTAGTSYGDELDFTTSTVVTDIDGNIYNTVIIGSQVWMAENLRTTHYRNGDSIPNVTDNSKWSKLKSGAYCNYNNDINISKTYGKLYNWYAVNDKRNLAPAGWHVPTDSEWTILSTYLGGENIAGAKLKEIGTTHWNSPNVGADNSSGFLALPGGGRYLDGRFLDFGTSGNWWTATASVSPQAWYRYLHCDYTRITRDDYGSWNVGNSIRCVKD